MSAKTLLTGVAAVAGTAGLARWVDDKLNFSADYETIKSAQRNLAQLQEWAAQNKSSVCERFIETAQRIPNGLALIFEDKEYTWKQLDAMSNQFANWLISIAGVKPGDMVALCFENSLEMYISYLGVSKAGAISALMNHNLRLNAFTHCFKLAKSSLLVFQSNLGSEIVTPIEEELLQSGRIFQFSLEGKETGSWDRVDLSGIPDTDNSQEARKGVKMGDVAMLIYTSGTTGLPKAAAIIQNRYNRTGFQGKARGYGEKDRWFCALPLYHSAAQIGLHTSWATGMTLVLVRKFSARNFFPDCAKTGCTIAQYIGELIRYVMMVEPRPSDRQHKIKVVFGNGLRGDIWLEFKRRFGINEVHEFYGASEGTFSTLTKHIGLSPRGAGTCGRIGPYFRKMIGSPKIVKFDVLEEQVIRGPDGFCIECAPGEAGEIIGRVAPDDPKLNPLRMGVFDGYYGQKEATDKKILRDAFAKGDAWLRMGDLMKMDSEGYLYFVDRVGDSFRFKGENVSTMELGNTVSQFPSIEEVNIYGISLPGHDGRAGAAAIVWQKAGPHAVTSANEAEVVAKLGKFLEAQVASYAIPRFLRIQEEIEITGTLKHRKVELQKDGVDPDKIKDKLWWWDINDKVYKPLGNREYLLLTTGKARL